MAASDIPSGRILIQGAHLLTQDPALGTLTGDILIDDGRIVEVGPYLDATGAAVIDGTDRAVLPGFVDTHRHTWQGAIRQTGIGWDFARYRKCIQPTWGPEFTPDDTVRIVKHHGRLVHVDPDRIRAQAITSRERLLATPVAAD